MRKKLLFLEIEKLISKNKELYNDNKALSYELDKKNSQLSELENTVELLNRTIAELSQTNSSKLNNTESVDEIETVSDDTDGQNELLKEAELVELSDDINSGAQIIGKVVLKCAELCNEFSEKGGQNAKDLINLALGRTEVFKSEVLQIISSDQTEQEKTTNVNEKLNSVYEYFEMLYKQL